MKGNECLNQYISFNECSALNVEDAETLKAVLSLTSNLKSNEDDPQILITLKFNQNVNITYIQIEVGKNTDLHPSALKVFVGRDDLDFDDVQDMQATEKFELENNLGKAMKVNIPRFRNVNIMTVRILFFNYFYYSYFYIIMMRHKLK